MNIEQLKIFVSLAQTLNFSRTAEIFFLTQPAVTHQIKMLERSLGASLLQRSNRNVQLTSEGKEFLTYAIQILEMAQNAKNRVENISEGRTGRIRIAALSSTTLVLSECLAIFAKQYPLIQVDIDIIEGTELIETLNKSNTDTNATDKYDFFFMVISMLPEAKRYDYIVTGNYQLNLFVHRDDAPSIDMTDWSTIEKHPFVSVSQSDYVLANRIEKICKEKNCKPNIINYYNRAESVIISVNARIGVAILPSSLGLIYQRPDVITIPIDGDGATLSYIIAYDHTTLSSSALKFHEVIQKLYINEKR